MPTRTVLARSLPYRPTLTTLERVCRRCGIHYRIGQAKRDAHLTECRDCRGVA